MERLFDISAKVKMASVRYLHTMRFLKEVLAFCSHFPQLIDAFQRMKAMAQGNLVREGEGEREREIERGGLKEEGIKSKKLLTYIHNCSLLLTSGTHMQRGLL